MTKQEIEAVAQYCRINCSEEAKNFVFKADQICDKVFHFTRRWDMERTAEPVKFEHLIQWDYMPKDDLEWTVMLARHSYLYDVAYAYLITQNQKYYDCFVNLVQEFIDNCPFDPSESCNSWRTLDVGIRATVWVNCIELLHEIKPFTDDFMQKVTTSLVQHFNYLEGCMNNYHLLSNWGVLANSGAVHAAYYLNKITGKDYSANINSLISLLAEQIKIQVLNDGMHWEQSPMYHHEVLWCYLELIVLAQKTDIKLPDIIMQKTKDMCYATMHEAKPNHCQPMRGDSDDTDVRDILTLGAFLFNDSTLKAAAYQKLDAENAWRAGCNGIDLYSKLDTGLLPNLGMAFADSGNYYFKSGSESFDTWVHFRCGTIGSGHGHADLLHLDLFALGKDILTDSGRYTYVNKAQRTDLKSCFAHNTVVVDNKDFTDCCASWRFGEIAKPVKGEYLETKNLSYVSGAHLGYINDGVFVKREVVFIKPDILVIYDSFFGKGTHNYKQLFHFGEGEVTNTASGAIFKSGDVSAAVQTFASNASCDVKDSVLSKIYNHSQANKCLEIETELTDGGIITVVTFGNAYGCNVQKMPVQMAIEKTVLPDESAQAVKITTDNDEYTVLFSRKEIIGKVNMLCVGECKGYGEAMVFDKNSQCTVLSW